MTLKSVAKFEEKRTLGSKNEMRNLVNLNSSSRKASLNKSDCNVLNTEDLTRRFREETIPAGYKMIFFDLKTLFTNVPLDYVLKKVYDEKKIQSKIPKTVLKELLHLCTKQLYFTLNNSIYIRCDGVAMGSPFRPLLANIFMTSLEEDLITNTKIVSLLLETIR